MAEYLVNSTDARTFTVLANATVLGTLKYAEWFSFESVLTLTDGTSLRIEPKGFWGTTVEVKDQTAVVLSFNMHWNGNIVLKSRLGGTNKAFVVQNRGVLKNDFVLVDKEGHELLTIRPTLKWNKANYDYTVTSTEIFETLEVKNILLLVAIHCTNYYMSMMLASAMIATM
ncbi:hypothetical protein [Hymenobacter sp. AT01-02]|uniref:hypothetical protein n=1 Tax=Hymenobacter sp. AT01-02 TaxID=1571877 RepID=UPI0005F127B0|nr:hypothetical protein [Hymenobacter sp. AT01-02]